MPAYSWVLQIVGSWGYIVIYSFQMLFQQHLKMSCMTDLHVILENVIFYKGRNPVNCDLKAIVSVLLIQKTKQPTPVLSLLVLICKSEMMKCPQCVCFYNEINILLVRL